jgi:hypothetical protein
MPGVADDLAVLMALRVQGIASPERVAAATGDDTADVAAELTRLASSGYADERTGRVAGFALTITGSDQLDNLLVAENLRESEGLKDCYELFLTLNNRVLKLSSDWQLRDGAPNDHSDPSYDEGVIDRLSELNDGVRACMRKIVGCAPRFAPYASRLDDCVERLLAGDTSAFTKPLAESYHTVWFELHQDLLLTLGLKREE